MTVHYQRKKKKMKFSIVENMLIQLKRKTWYYNNKIKLNTKKNHPDGGFLKKGEHLLVCEVIESDAGVMKYKMLHNKKNTVYLIMSEEDTCYWFEEPFACN